MSAIEYPLCLRIPPGVNSFRSAATFVERRFDRYLCSTPRAAHASQQA
jgi:hypothetical protein